MFSQTLFPTRPALGVAFAMLAAGVSTAQADFQLSERYTDRDGDLVADIPEDESQWRDPDTLVFAYTPVEDPAVYADVWSGFLDHMEEVTGKEVRFFPVQSNAAQIEAMRAGRLHVAGFNTGSNPLAVACAGFRPFAMMAAEDGSFGYEMEIITYPDSGIDEVEDIEGKTLTHTSETSNSGYKAPTALMASEFGMTSGEDYEVDFSGKHDNSILGVANHDYEVATIANSVKARMLDRDVIDADQIEVIYQSDTFPTTGYGVAHDLKPELQEAIKEAFFSFDWEGSALAEEFGKNGESQFIPITFKKHWSVIRQIDAANGVDYQCS
ncbi:phosphate/phosphite/phosphonate ABC transporter substrate-binding protein [Chromohalobacter canadensis]|uniref:phosphate/phosphite/phosphonate ABC transporter substrate-binding protein n=1 Tax=Chromohalobacter canadensis TaxID=141389 RepID=UPI003C6C69B2|nr:phosphate/phosphite/phosphonate ABC transporter substrate-binding protein [Chromohalobacter canadensis]MCT8472934.1 phosphate/phosphite/phosphonate ABC transporter substrate-binding protein [Chromohalobacter canadensis]MCT8500386.1 phosphate/phosphite/phosphonate ABC transporter substrate-binding protein [Chromohalobacter canadensis]